MIGTTFAGFTVLDRINRGGMADIYLVQDAAGQKHTLRVLLPEHRYSWREIRRFWWGCKVLAQLDHPNVIHFEGSGKFRGLRYAVLEYVPGTNLREKILRNDAGLRVHPLRLLVGMAAALAHVHERGFLHLDFKPENILVSPSYDPKLVDFDLAIRRPPRPKRISVLSGTPSYLAPEQIYRQPVDERADIFAFGMTAYEMVTGKKPVSGLSRAEVLRKYVNFEEHLKPIRHYVPDFPQHLDRVIRKCLEKDPARRYPTMSLVLRDLQS